MIMFGFAMVLIMLWRPQGLVSHREPSIRLNAGRLGAKA
jgi:branched-chain amino acid transport system permease protein